MTSAYRVRGTNAKAPFTLTIHRGDGMALLAMSWRNGRRPPRDFVGFGIQYRPPGATKALNVNNRLSFEGTPDFGKRRPSMKAPIQKFRWVHFPFDADRPGPFRYTVTPIFMDPDDHLRSGEAQEAEIELRRETYPGKLNVSFTRGFIASQAFVDTFCRSEAELATLLPARAADGLGFVPTHTRAAAALDWMGFEARRSILDVLDEAIADPTTRVRIVAYDLSEPDVLSRMEQLGTRLRVIIDDSGSHEPADSGESRSAVRLAASAGPANVERQHMGNLQHNKTIVVSGPNLQKVVCGSTNFSWRGFFVQNNNAVVLNGETAVELFGDAFEHYWGGSAAGFRKSPSPEWSDLGLAGIDARVTFSPHSTSNAVLDSVADDIRAATSSVLYSLAFLYQTTGAVRDAVQAVTSDPAIFVAGISDRAVGGITVQTPDGNVAPVFPEALAQNVPAPFSEEIVGGSGIRMHHKFVVIDFDKPTARVYLGSYNFSSPADNANGENLLLVADRRVATAYAIEAVRIFDHYQFRVRQRDEATAVTTLALRKPPRTGELPWFDDDYTDANQILDRKLFA
ncbi:MAG: phospholipase D-like domain-containing protein [Acidimicrobiia bacterium]|jgi:phosphatidylserine/phosphatidylglycerophosphate/cardiolipin synthase-like enzyme